MKSFEICIHAVSDESKAPLYDETVARGLHKGEPVTFALQSRTFNPVIVIHDRRYVISIGELTDAIFEAVKAAEEGDAG